MKMAQISTCARCTPDAMIYRVIFATTALLFLIDVVQGRNMQVSSTSVPVSHGKATKQSPYDIHGDDYVQATQRFNITLEESKYLSESDANLLLAKNSYCTCECCRPKLHGPDTCKAMVRANLPQDFKCPENFCQQALKNSCAKWNKDRCEKTCFCQKCKYKLPAGDDRCAGELESAANCQCQGHETSGDKICVAPTQGIAKLWLFLVRARMNKKFIKCTMGCFCKHCDRTALSANFVGLDMTRTCAAHPNIPSHCSLPCPPCPNHHAASQAQQTLRQISLLQGSHS